MKIYLLGNIADVQTGPFGSQLHKEDYVEFGTPMVTVEHLGNRVFTKQNLPMISDSDKKRLNKYVLNEGDIVFSRVGSVDRCSYVDNKHLGWMFSGRCLRIRPRNVVYPLYLYYYFCMENTKQFIRNIAVGATMPSINTKLMEDLKVPLPTMEMQQKIASILSALDDKIELNNRINENLESQAQAIFIDLFITNAKPEWKMGTISDLGNVVGGGTPSKKVEEYYTNDGIAWITPKDLSNDKSKFITHGETDITDLGLAKSSATLMPRGSVLFSSRAPIGYIAIADGQVSTNQGFKSIVPFDNVGTAYVYYFLKENLSAIENVASGSTFKEVSGGTMKNFPAVIPDDDTLAKFKQFCSPLLEQQRALEYENRYLASLRDTLLPKLMNGEIDVSEIKI